MARRRANKIGTPVRIIAHDIDAFKGMRPFHEKRFGRITGHNYTDRDVITYTVAAGDGQEYRLTREQFATSALKKSSRYPEKAK